MNVLIILAIIAAIAVICGMLGLALWTWLIDSQQADR